MSKNIKNSLDNSINKLKIARKNISALDSKNIIGDIVKDMGFLGTGTAQVFLWVIKKGFLNNAVLRRIEKELKNNSRTPKSVKIKSELYSYILYYLILSGVVLSGFKSSEKIKDAVNKLGKKEAKKESDINNFYMNPKLTNSEWEKQNSEIHAYILMDVIHSEGVVEEMYADVGQSSGYLTIGAGFMIGKVSPVGNRDKEIIKEKKAFFKKALGRPLLNGTKISNAEMRLLTSEWLRIRVYPTLKKRFTKPINASVYRALCVIAYNRGEGIFNKGQVGYPVREAINKGENPEVIAKMLSAFFVDGNAGLKPKYGVVAHQILGNISDVDMLKAKANSAYKMIGDSLWSGNKLRVNYGNKAANDLVNIKNANIYKNGRVYIQKPVKDYLTKGQIDTISNGLLFKAGTIDMEDVLLVDNIRNSAIAPTKSELLNEQGEDLYFVGDYEGAIKKFRAGLKEDPKNYILYSNISIAYYKAGKYEEGRKIVADILDSEIAKDMPDNIKAYSYYNAGICREKLGDLSKNIKDKLDNYDKAKKNIKNADNLTDDSYLESLTRIEKKIFDMEKASKFKKADLKLKTPQPKKVNLKNKSR